MHLTRCPACGNDVSTQATTCPSCGQPQWKEKKTKWWLWVPLGVGIAFTLVGLLSPETPESKEKALQRATIEMCWADQGRKSHDSGAAQFIAGACERMEQKFREKWGVAP